MDIINENLEGKLSEIFQEIFEISSEQVKESSILTTTKWDSFSHMTLMLYIEELMGTEGIPADKISQLTSFQMCLEFVQKQS